jgi:hypothetical protein
MLRALEASTWLEGKVEKGKVNTGGDYNRLMLEKKKWWENCKHRGLGEEGAKT